VKLRLSRKKVDDELLKKLIYLDLRYGLEYFATVEILDLINMLSISDVEFYLSMVLRDDPGVFCDSFFKIQRILKDRINVEVPELCLEREQQTQAK